MQVGQLTSIIYCYNLRVTIDDLLRWEEKYGEKPRRAVAIMNSGWSSKYPNKSLVFGSPELSNVSSFHFPSWHEDAVTWLINKRQINAVGVDTPSTDYGQTTNDKKILLELKTWQIWITFRKAEVRFIFRS